MSTSFAKDRLMAVGAAVIACALTWGTARAQTPPTTANGFADDRFEPAGGGSQWFSLDSIDFRGNFRAAAGLAADLALRPLVVYDRAGNAIAPLVSRQALLHADAALVLSGRLRVDLNVPVSIVHDGTGTSVGGVTYVPPTGEPLGDVRLGADVRLFGEPHEPITLAVGAQVFFPTGRQSAFTGDGGLRFWPRLLLAGQVGPFEWAARLGYHLRPPLPKCGCSLQPGSELTGALALGVRILPTVLLGAEGYASTPAQGGTFGKGAASPLEGLLGAHVAVTPDWSLGVGAAPGSDGVGSPAWRFVASIAYFAAFAPPARPAAPATPAPAPVPPPVRAPAAVKVPPPPPPTPVPPPPPPPPPPPADRDGDGIVDPDDACPDVPGPRNDDPVRNGCPVVRIEGGQIRIREQVKFKTDSAVILKESGYILAGVVKLLAENPEIKKLRVEGHTDAQGKPKRNKKLSERRAASVVKWLVKYGVAKKRLTSAGFGQERPLANNQTEEGRRENRRVEFHIVEGPGGER